MTGSDSFARLPHVGMRSDAKIYISHYMKKLVHHREKCLECAGCVGICPFTALDMVGLDLQIDTSRCRCCGLCERACPAGALKIEEVGNAR